MVGAHQLVHLDICPDHVRELAFLFVTLLDPPHYQIAYRYSVTDKYKYFRLL